MLEKWKIKCKMSLVLELVLQASSQLINPLITEGSNTKLTSLSNTYRNSPECWENERKKNKMNPLLELVIEASNQLWNPLGTEGSNTELNLLSHTHRKFTRMLGK
jgi:hypothetical protein